jgi:hypothetical protein
MSNIKCEPVLNMHGTGALQLDDATWNASMKATLLLAPPRSVLYLADQQYCIPVTADPLAGMLTFVPLAAPR